MSRSDSSSSSSSTTQNNSEDNRVVGEANSTTLGKNAILQINEQFPEPVAEAFQQLISFGEKAGVAIVDIANKALDSNLALSQASIDNVQEAAKGATSVLSDQAKIDKGGLAQSQIAEMFPIIAVAVLGLALIMMFKK